MFPLARVVSIMVVLSVGVTALLVGAWYTGYVSGRMFDRSSPSWAAPPHHHHHHHHGQEPQGHPRATASAASAALRVNGARGGGTAAGGGDAGRRSSSAAAAAAAAESPPERYAVLIDAGSSGSRVHVYKYRPPPGRRRGGATLYPVVQLPGRIQRVHPGLSEFAPDGEGVEESLGPLIKFAQDQVPRGRHAATPIRLLATAGLRMLPGDHCEAVLGAVRRLLARSGFRFQPDWVRLISGDEEGLFAWTGINYAAGRLQALAREAASSPRLRDPEALAGRAAATTLAVLELGGASMQLTLMPWEPLPGGLGTRLELPGVDRPLYTHSFLGYGLQVAWFREAMLVQQGGENATDPCSHPGYMSYQSGVVGSGSFDSCAALAEQLIAVNGPAAGGAAAAVGSSISGSSHGSSSCSFVRCSIGDEYLPLLAPERLGRYGGAALLDSGSKSAPGLDGYLIMATESFYYTLDRLGLPANASLDSLRTAGARFCARPWSEVEQELVIRKGVSEDHVLKVCFGAAYIYTLLRQGFQMGPREAAYLRFTNRVQRPDGSQVEVNWVLGALLMELTSPNRGRAPARPAAAAASASSTEKRAPSARTRAVTPPALSWQPPPPVAAAGGGAFATAGQQLRQLPEPLGTRKEVVLSRPHSKGETAVKSSTAGAGAGAAAAEQAATGAAATTTAAASLATRGSIVGAGVEINGGAGGGGKISAAAVSFERQRLSSSAAAGGVMGSEFKGANEVAAGVPGAKVSKPQQTVLGQVAELKAAAAGDRSSGPLAAVAATVTAGGSAVPRVDGVVTVKPRLTRRQLLYVTESADAAAAVATAGAGPYAVTSLSESVDQMSGGVGGAAAGFTRVSVGRRPVGHRRGLIVWCVAPVFATAVGLAVALGLAGAQRGKYDGVAMVAEVPRGGAAYGGKAKVAEVTRQGERAGEGACQEGATLGAGGWEPIITVPHSPPPRQVCDPWVARAGRQSRPSAAAPPPRVLRRPAWQSLMMLLPARRPPYDARKCGGPGLLAMQGWAGDSSTNAGNSDPRVGANGGGSAGEGRGEPPTRALSAAATGEWG